MTAIEIAQRIQRAINEAEGAFGPLWKKDLDQVDAHLARAKVQLQIAINEVHAIQDQEAP